MSILLLAVLQAVAQPATPPQRIPTRLLSPNDYPTAAILLGQEGAVEARLTVGADGKPTACTIVGSSGFPALDTATCANFKARARFSPALDNLGRPTIGTWTQTVHWVIEGNELPVAPWTIRVMAALDKRGSLTKCSIQAGGALKNRVPMVVDCSELSGAFTVPADLAQRYAGREAVLIFDQQFVPRVVNSINAPLDLVKYPLVSKDVLRIGIDEQGRVVACTQTGAEGDYKPVLQPCPAMSSRRFRPNPKAQGKILTGTATTATYVYLK